MAAPRADLPPVGAEIYVYYRVADPVAAHACVARIFEDVARMTGVRGRLLTRCDDPATWLEVYAKVGTVGAFMDVLDAAVEAAAFTPHLIDRRHVECFQTSAAAPRVEQG